MDNLNDLKPIKKRQGKITIRKTKKIVNDVNNQLENNKVNDINDDVVPLEEKKKKRAPRKPKQSKSKDTTEITEINKLEVSGQNDGEAEPDVKKEPKTRTARAPRKPKQAKDVSGQNDTEVEVKKEPKKRAPKGKKVPDNLPDNPTDISVDISKENIVIEQLSLITTKTYLTQTGYRINKKLNDPKLLLEYKTELTVKPFSADDPDIEPYPVYQETPRELIVPRYYGIDKLGKPDKDLIKYGTVNSIFTGQLRDFQIEIVDKCLKHIKEYGGGILSVGCGRGKCFAKGTKILMFDGTIKKVEDITVNDYLMGDDSTPRKVLSLAHGLEEMFDIIPIDLNGEKYTVNRSHILSLKSGDDIIDISVNDYLTTGKKMKGFRVPVEFEKKPIPIDPYTFGKTLQDTVNAHIPYIYKCNCKDVRFNLLTGITETFGLDIKVKNEMLLDDIIFVCRSLGFVCKKNRYSEYFQTKIFGAENDLLTYDIDVRSVGIGEYFGFEIDGNRRFLLEDFTVTHNTVMALKIAMELGVKTLVIVHKSFLQDQWIDRAKQFTNARLGIIRQNKVQVINKDIIIGMIQSISMKEYDPAIFSDIGMVIYDECLVGDQLILTDKGWIPIEELYRLWVRHSPLPLAKSYNEISGKYEFKQITYAWKKNTTDVITIDLTSGLKISCTSNHKFLTMYGYKEARFLDKNDLLIGYCRADGDNLSYLTLINNSVESVSTIKDLINVYDIEVDQNHNFVVGNGLFGTVVHNCHHVASRVFSNALAKTGAKYTLGLSATPIRLDGLTRVIHWYVGEFIHREQNRKNKQVIAKIFHYVSNNPLFREKKKWFKKAIKPDTIKMTSNFCELAERTTHVINIINQLRVFPERKILVLSSRKAHLTELKDAVDNAIAADIEKNVLLPNECKTYFYTGDSNREQRKEAETNGDILFATFELAHEGLDIERLNTIILATPKKNIIQAVGRIMRKILISGDVRPLIIDISDDVSVFKYQSEARIAQYSKNKYKVEHYYLKNDKIITFDTYMEQQQNMTHEEIILMPARVVYEPKLSVILDMQRVEYETGDITADICTAEAEDEPEVINTKVSNSSYMF